MISADSRLPEAYHFVLHVTLRVNPIISWTLQRLRFNSNQWFIFHLFLWVRYRGFLRRRVLYPAELHGRVTPCYPTIL